MKRALLLTTLFVGFATIQTYAQCKKTHYFCTSQFTKEQQSEYWDLNNQSKSATFAKGKVYELSFICYKGYDYRLSVCTDILDGTGDKVSFELFQDAIVRDEQTQRISKQRESIYNNTNDNMKTFVKFATDKTKKFYLEVNVPATGESKNKTLNQNDLVCVGVLLEHKKGSELGF